MGVVRGDFGVSKAELQSLPVTRQPRRRHEVMESAANEALKSDVHLIGKRQIYKQH